MFLFQIKLGQLQKWTTGIIEAKQKDLQELRQAVEMFKVRGHLYLSYCVSGIVLYM